MSFFSRRTFVSQVLFGSALLTFKVASADDPPTKVTEDDPYAKSMGFRTDTARVDQVKFPRHDTTQHCSRCQLFSGAANEPEGPCSFYGGRIVPINGWCRNFKLRKELA